MPLLLGSISAFKEQSSVSWQHTSYPLGPVMKESATRRNYDCYQFGKVLLTNWGLVRWSAGMERDKPDDTVDRKLPGGTKTKWKKQIRNEREIPSCPQTSFFNYPDSHGDLGTFPSFDVAAMEPKTSCYATFSAFRFLTFAKGQKRTQIDLGSVFYSFISKMHPCFMVETDNIGAR